MNLLELLKPIEIGNQTIRNRLVGMAQEQCFDEHGELQDWAECARGAFGLCLLKAGSVHPSSGLEPTLFGHGALALFKSIARRGDADQTLVIQRLTHGGNLFTSFGGDVPWGVSARRGPTGLVAKPMTADEILEIRLAYVSAALMCQEAGLAGVAISACSGNLIQQFLSPLHNDRRDAYGGSVENRSRFLFETLRAVRAAVGPDFIVGASLGKDTLTPEDPDDLSTSLLRQLESERLLDFVELYAPIRRAARAQDDLPRVLSCHYADLREAADYIVSGRADLVCYCPPDASAA